VTDRPPVTQRRDEQYAKAHQNYLARLEGPKRTWGPLAYGVSEGVDRPCAAGGPDWSESIVSELQTLLEKGELPEPFSLLEIAPSASSPATAIVHELPASCYVLCPAKGACAVHAVAQDDRVRVYDVDMRQLFNENVTKKLDAKPFDVAVLLQPSVLSPQERTSGVDRYLPELACRWLGRNARFALVSLDDRSAPASLKEGGQSRRLAISSEGVALWAL
jgi:hypothetical protein